MISDRDLIPRLREMTSRRLKKLPLVGPWYEQLSNRWFVPVITRDLRLLNDILAKEEIADRYWVWAGLLLGAVREGGVIAHDRDADFAILPDDIPKFLRAVPALRRAGFKPLAR